LRETSDRSVVIRVQRESGDLQVQVLLQFPVLCEEFAHQRNEARVAKLYMRDVHGNRIVHATTAPAPTLMDCCSHNPVAQRNDEAAALGLFDDILDAFVTCLGAPTQQRFDAGYLPVHEGDLRLVAQVEFPARE